MTVATEGVGAAVAEREGRWPKEEDLRAGLAAALRRTDAIVFTEARLHLDGWTANLGGFDVVAIGPDASAVVMETKWADGTLWQAIWDVVKLASATTLPRVTAAYAVYCAPVGHWATKPGADLFGDRGSQSAVTDYLLSEADDIWERNLKGSTAYPTVLPGAVTLTPITQAAATVLGREFETRAVRVTAVPNKQLRLDRGRLPAAQA